MSKIRNHCHGLFVSVWSGGIINTACTLDTDTGELTTDSVNVPNDLGVLEREYFEAPDGEEIPVCPTCHEFIMKPAMNPARSGHTLLEDHECSNSDCDSRE